MRWVWLAMAGLCVGCGPTANQRPDARDVLRDNGASASEAPATAKVKVGTAAPAVDELRAVAPAERWILRVRKPPDARYTDPEQACAADHFAACFVLGTFYEHGNNVDRDLDRARELYVKACEGGVPLACYNAGVFYEQGAGVERDPGRAFAYLERACEGGEPRGCGEIAYMFEHGIGVDTDLDAAEAIYDRACKALDMQSCNNLAWVIRRKDSPEHARAAELYLLACNRGYRRACPRLSYLKARGCLDDARDCVAEPADDAGYVPMLKAECEDRHAVDACVTYAQHLEYGEHGVTKDLAGAFAQYEAACNADDAWGCNSLANLYRRGDHVEKDAEHALELYRKACDAGYLLACSDSGLMYINGDDVPQNIKRGTDHVRRACAEGMHDACTTLITLCAIGIERACTL